MNFRKSVLGLALIVSLVACGNTEVPQDIVDQNMTITRLNAQKNADSYRTAVYPEGTVDAKLGIPTRALMQSDSTVSKQCRNGDGWASGAIEFANGNKLKIKCQTNGTGKGVGGCMTESEFATKTYKDDDGKCQNLETLEKFK